MATNAKTEKKVSIKRRKKTVTQKQESPAPEEKQEETSLEDNTPKKSTKYEPAPTFADFPEAEPPSVEKNLTMERANKLLETGDSRHNISGSLKEKELGLNLAVVAMGESITRRQSTLSSAVEVIEARLLLLAKFGDIDQYTLIELYKMMNKSIIDAGKVVQDIVNNLDWDKMKQGFIDYEIRTDAVVEEDAEDSYAASQLLQELLRKQREVSNEEDIEDAEFEEIDDDVEE